MALGNRVKTRREELGLAQHELAKIVGVTQASIHLLEQRDSRSSRKLHLLAKALNVGAEWLATGKGQNIQVNEDSSSDLESLDPVIKEIVELLEGREFDELMAIKGWIHSIDILRSTKRQRKKSAA